MFVLSKVKDTVPIFPTEFSLETHVAINSYLHKKYANKVLQQVGFCMAVWDLLECGDGKVRWGDGAVWYKVVFRLLVFQPVIGEVFVGKVIDSTPDRIRVSLGFFDDIYILASALPPDEFIYDPDEPEQPTGAHHWLVPQDEEDAAEGIEPTRLPILNSDLIRLRLTSTKFQEHEPGPPRERTRVVDGIVEEIPLPEGEEVLPGWLLEGTIAEQGLGCVDWWPVPEEDGEGEGGVEGEGDMVVD